MTKHDNDPIAERLDKLEKRLEKYESFKEEVKDLRDILNEQAESIAADHKRIMTLEGEMGDLRSVVLGDTDEDIEPEEDEEEDEEETTPSPFFVIMARHPNMARHPKRKQVVFFMESGDEGIDSGVWTSAARKATSYSDRELAQQVMKVLVIPPGYTTLAVKELVE